MISVCVATYNGEKYIKRQLESILQQLDSNDEVIISDDGSSDNTIDVIEGMSDQRIKIYINTGMHGFTHNFENALVHATGDYIFLSDQDDVWVNNKVEVMLKYLENFNFVTHDCITVNDKNEILQTSRFDAFNMKSGFFRHLLKSRFLGCCMAFDRKMLDTILPFPKNDSLLEHDVWIAAVGFLYFKCKMVSEPLIYYCRHGDNTSSGGFEKGYSMLNKVIRRGYRIICLGSVRKKAQINRNQAVLNVKK